MPEEPQTEISSPPQIANVDGEDELYFLGKKEELPRTFTRIKTYFAFLILIFLLGLPIWYNTTKIEQEQLPLTEMLDLEKSIYQKISMEIPVFYNADDASNKIFGVVESELNTLINRERLPFEYKVKFIQSYENDAPDEIFINYKQQGANLFEISKYGKTIDISGSDTEFITNKLFNSLFKHEIEMYQQKNAISLDTSTNYQLSFYLLAGDGDAISWEFKEFYESKLQKFIDLISQFANFTIDSQIEYYSPLNVQPVYNNETKEFVIDEKDTSIFINHEKWNLGNILISPSEDNSLNFIHLILYVPSLEFQPLRISNSKRNSFVTPQFGGIQIYNTKSNHLTEQELTPVFELWISQILTLLGISKYPKSPQIRIDFLKRFFIVQNLIKSTNTLGSLVRLINSLPTISIPSTTSKNVDNALLAIQKSLSFLLQLDFLQACKFSNLASIELNLAFFEKDMVQQIYFPDEHKFAVYSPLLGPILTILFLGFMRIFKDIKMIKRLSKEKKDK